MINSTLAGQDADMSEHAAGANGAGEHGDTRPRSGHLELEISEFFLRLIVFVRAQLTHAAGAVGFVREDEHRLDQPKAKKGRRKQTRLVVRALRLGQRMIARTDEVDIVVKFLYRKPKKIVCQLRRNNVYIKIDILWSNIQAMRACFDNNRFDTLRIKVKSSSEQYRATQAPAGRHRLWQRCNDFTPRTFYLEFKKGTLERSYGKMLYTDPSLILLSSSPPGKEEEAQATNTKQVLTQQACMFTAVPVPSFVEATMPNTRMIGSTNTGTDFAVHEYGSIQLYDSTQLAQVHPLYR